MVLLLQQIIKMIIDIMESSQIILVVPDLQACLKNNIPFFMLDLILFLVVTRSPPRRAIHLKMHRGQQLYYNKNSIASALDRQYPFASLSG